jgi:transcriptional regulator with AAA-type ATPase domain
MTMQFVLRNSQFSLSPSVFGLSLLIVPTDSASTASQSTAQFPIRAIVRSLQDNGGNKQEAARALGMSRATIYRKTNDYGIAYALVGPKAFINNHHREVSHPSTMAPTRSG